MLQNLTRVSVCERSARVKSVPGGVSHRVAITQVQVFTGHCCASGMLLPQHSEPDRPIVVAALTDRAVGRSVHAGVPRCNLGGLHNRISMTR